MKYLNNLLSSEIFYYKKNNPDFNIKDSGLYILHPRFDLKKISGKEYLKVGMTVRKGRGLKGRLSEHFSSNIVGSNDCLQSDGGVQVKRSREVGT